MFALSVRRLAGFLLAASALAIASPSTAFAASPPNDNLADATVVSSLPFGESVDVTEATREPSEPTGCLAPPVERTVWYSFTPAVDQILSADTAGSSVSSALSVFRRNGPGFDGLGHLACQFFGNPATFTAEAGTTYLFQAAAFPFSAGGVVRFNLRAIPPPPNDDFDGATVVASLPFSDSVDTTAADAESGEPTASCGFGPSTGTVWYAFTPAVSGSVSATAGGSFSAAVDAFSGTALNGLTDLGCRAFGQPLTIHVNAGETYYFQVGGVFGGRGSLTFNLVVTPPPVASFSFSPGDPSVYDVVQFFDQSFDPGQAGIQSRAWDFGDGATGTGCCPTHRYAADGDYTATLTITTSDGRTASTTRLVRVITHDVGITKLTVPTAASAGQTRQISVGIRSNLYPETVTVQLFKSVPGGFQFVGSLTQDVPVRSSNRTIGFAFAYTFTSDDAVIGKVTFKAVANLMGARDALPADNEAIASPTKVSR